jgi:rfaE bifunctional protein nucleotidyltransferase chain/domain
MRHFSHDRDVLERAGVRTVLTHGCFDVIHIGHLRLLRYARSLGDELVVSVLTDEYVRAAKGDKRPIHPLNVRLEHLQCLKFVDRVAIVDGPGHEAVQKMIGEVRPAIYVKGSEYAGRIPEQDFLDAIGVKVVYMGMVMNGDANSSSSSLIREFSD